MKDIVIEKRPSEGVALLELNHSHAPGALKVEVWHQLTAAAERLAGDRDIRVIDIAACPKRIMAAGKGIVLEKAFMLILPQNKSSRAS